VDQVHKLQVVQMVVVKELVVLVQLHQVKELVVLVVADITVAVVE
jgi:hypothetical protein